MNSQVVLITVMWILVFSTVGCNHVKGNVGNMPKYGFMATEPEWIRNGDPLEHEGEFWYPQDTYDTLLDQEMFLLGRYKGTEYFIDKIDVKPYNRLYTKFGHNKFRVYLKKK